MGDGMAMGLIGCIMRNDGIMLRFCSSLFR